MTVNKRAVKIRSVNIKRAILFHFFPFDRLFSNVRIRDPDHVGESKRRSKEKKEMKENGRELCWTGSKGNGRERKRQADITFRIQHLTITTFSSNLGSSRPRIKS
jgi:hypothetical protein